MERPTEEFELGVQRAADREQQIVDLEQAIADRDQAIANRDQALTDRRQESLDEDLSEAMARGDQQGPALSALSVLRRQQERLDRSQDALDSHQSSLNSSQHRRDQRQVILDREEDVTILGDLEEPPSGGGAEHEASARAKAALLRAEAARFRAQAMLRRAEWVAEHYRVDTQPLKGSDGTTHREDRTGRAT
jgi:hypothetical protein